MNDSSSFENRLSDIGRLCAEASERNVKALDELGAMLLMAGKRSLKEWDGSVLAVWEEGLEKAVEAMDVRKLSPEAIRLLAAMLELGFDRHVFRECYAGYAKAVFGSVYANPIDLTSAIGFLDDDVPVERIARRCQVMAQVRLGAFCYEAAFGFGKIVDIDALTGEIYVQMDRRRSMKLCYFLDNVLLVKAGTNLESILSKNPSAHSYDGLEAFLADACRSVVSIPVFPIEETVKKMAVPAVMNEEEFKQMVFGQKTESVEEGKGAVEQNEARRWDNSRSIAELVERLKNTESLKAENVNTESIHNILKSAARRADQGELFAQAIAMIWKDGTYCDKLCALFEEIGENAAIWNDSQLFLAITDKLAGKLVPCWIEATREARGNEYLLDQTILLPYRLWGHVERLLARKADEKNLLVDRVFKSFDSGVTNAEMYFWLWRWKPTTEEGKARRERYISDAYLLFKTLRIEVRGSYLKSQRTLHRMLVDDEEFQRQVMRNGDMEAIKALVRCAKHQPLLDVGERQSVLCKIVRYYPEAIHEVEERKVGPVRRIHSKVTSIRSYHAMQLELQNIIDVQIPENIQAIEHARSLGDLRENSEYKFAKEQQRLLGIKRTELENALEDYKPTDFRNVSLENGVNVGSTVLLTYDKNGKTELYHILGGRDGDVIPHAINFETELGQALLDKKVGAKIKMPSGDELTLTEIKPLTEEILAYLGTEE